MDAINAFAREGGTDDHFQSRLNIGDRQDRALPVNGRTVEDFAAGVSRPIGVDKHVSSIGRVQGSTSGRARSPEIRTHRPEVGSAIWCPWRSWSTQELRPILGAAVAEGIAD